jgi:site-specific DNA-methyltransferase (adenine-specific)
MNYMRTVDDKHFSLAIVDPPYGIGKNWKKFKSGNDYIESSYDNNHIPTKKYFDELFRISKNQIIWGYNYFTAILGSTNHLIIWDKLTSERTSFYSAGEIAFSSFNKPLQIIRVPWDGNRRGEETGIKKIHPHQKPIKLYEWLLKDYAQKGDVVFDSHLGSESSRIACYKNGFDFVGCEIDKDLFELGEKRFNNFIKNGYERVLFSQ